MTYQATEPEMPPEGVDDVAISAADPLAGMLQRVWLRVRRRKAWLDSLNSSEQHSEFFNDPDSWQAERRWQQSAAAKPWMNAIAEADQWLESDDALPLRRIKAVFHLSDRELDVLQAAAAMRIDPTLAPVFGYLQGGSQFSYLTTPLVTRLFGDDSRPLCRPGDNLGLWKLVCAGTTASGEAAPLISDPILPHWLAGDITPDAALVEFLFPAAPRHSSENGPESGIEKFIRDALSQGLLRRLIMTGPRGSGRAGLVAGVAEELGALSVTVNTDAISDENWPSQFHLLCRFALWGGIILIWRGSRHERVWPRHIPSRLIHVILREPDQEVARWECCTDDHLEMPRLSLEKRKQAWEERCPAFSNWAAADQDRLAENSQLWLAHIEEIGGRNPATADEARLLAREYSRGNIGDLGYLLSCPFRWDDLILQKRLLDSLKDLGHEAKLRSSFWENAEARRLFPRGQSLTALFTGSPGTGKSMAAQIIAADLQLDLYRIDLAKVVSKYIGETAKHLREIFAQAHRMSAILLFDEADSLFTKRTEVKDSHDRYANADTGYLLQLLEDYQGLAILTTNKRGNIDTAFLRRIRYVFDFPKPGPDERLEIWNRTAHALTGQEAMNRLQPATRLLAREIELSAAQIKNALLASIFVAKRQGEEINVRHLVAGVERELMKDGRSVGQHIKLALQ